ALVVTGHCMRRFVMIGPDDLGAGCNRNFLRPVRELRDIDIDGWRVWGGRGLHRWDYEGSAQNQREHRASAPRMGGIVGKQIVHGTSPCMTNFAILGILPRFVMHQPLTRSMRRHALRTKLLVCKSAIERRVDQRKFMPSAYNAELARAEQFAEFARGHRDRTGLADSGLSWCRKWVRERHCGVQRDIAFDLLQHLMDMSVQHRDRSERTQQRHRL